MTDEPDYSIRAALHARIKDALTRRDRPSLAVYRAALGAIDNAEAVPVSTVPPAGALEAAPVGAGSSDVPRRTLSEQQMRRLVQAETDELVAAADLIAPSNPAGADRLRHEAGLLQGLIGQAD